MLPISGEFTYKQKVQPKFGKIKVRLLVFFAIGVFTLSFVQLVFANSLATDGQKLAEAEKEISEIESQNTTLRVEIAKISSLNNLSQKANSMGLIKPTKTIVL